jgi:hypothetical protein
MLQGPGWCLNYRVFALQHGIRQSRVDKIFFPEELKTKITRTNSTFFLINNNFIIIFNTAYSLL